MNKRKRKTILDATNTEFKLWGPLPTRPLTSLKRNTQSDIVSKKLSLFIRERLSACPVMTRRRVVEYVDVWAEEQGVGQCGHMMINDIIREHAFFYNTGPWKKCFVRYGYDPRQSGGGSSSSSSSSSSSNDRAKNKSHGKSVSQAAMWPMPGRLQIIDRRQNLKEKKDMLALLRASSPADRDSPAAKIFRAILASSLVQIFFITDIYPGLTVYIDQHITFNSKCTDDGWLDNENMTKIKVAFSYFLHQAVNCMKAAKLAKSSASSSTSSATTPGLVAMNITRPPDVQALRRHALLIESQREARRKHKLATGRRARAAKRARVKVVEDDEDEEEEAAEEEQDVYEVYEDSDDSDNGDFSWHEDPTSSDSDKDEDAPEKLKPAGKIQTEAKRSQDVFLV
jgi:hypothetical protein